MGSLPWRNQIMSHRLLAAARDRGYRRDRLTEPRLILARSFSVFATSFYDRFFSVMCWSPNLRLNLPRTESDGRGFFSQIRLMSGLPPHLLTKAKTKHKTIHQQKHKKLRGRKQRSTQRNTTKTTNTKCQMVFGSRLIALRSSLFVIS